MPAARAAARARSPTRADPADTFALIDDLLGRVRRHRPPTPSTNSPATACWNAAHCWSGTPTAARHAREPGRRLGARRLPPAQPALPGDEPAAIVDWDRLGVSRAPRRRYGPPRSSSYGRRAPSTCRRCGRTRARTGARPGAAAAELAAAVHRVWWERLNDFWMLRWRYERGDRRADPQFPAASALAVWWTRGVRGGVRGVRGVRRRGTARTAARVGPVAVPRARVTALGSAVSRRPLTPVVPPASPPPSAGSGLAGLGLRRRRFVRRLRGRLGFDGVAARLAARGRRRRGRRGVRGRCPGPGAASAVVRGRRPAARRSSRRSASSEGVSSARCVCDVVGECVVSLPPPLPPPVLCSAQRDARARWRSPRATASIHSLPRPPPRLPCPSKPPSSPPPSRRAGSAAGSASCPRCRRGAAAPSCRRCPRPGCAGRRAWRPGRCSRCRCGRPASYSICSAVLDERRASPRRSGTGRPGPWPASACTRPSSSGGTRR